MWYWILGSPTMLPTPGQEIPQRWAGYRKGKETFPIGLYVSARYERMFVEHDELPQEGLMLNEEQRAILGHVSVDSFGAAVNLWLTRHVRFSANYFVNYLDGNMPVIQGSVRFLPAGALMQPTYRSIARPSTSFCSAPLWRSSLKAHGRRSETPSSSKASDGVMD